MRFSRSPRGSRSLSHCGDSIRTTTPGVLGLKGSKQGRQSPGLPDGQAPTLCRVGACRCDYLHCTRQDYASQANFTEIALKAE